MPWWLWLIIILLALAPFRKQIDALTEAINKKNQSGKKKPEKPSPPPAQPAATAPHEWPAIGLFDFPVAGESYRQEELQQIVGNTGDKFTRHKATATLVLDDNNPHDDMAVAVLIEGRPVGYLSKANARSYRRRLAALKVTSSHSICGALIKGGGTDANTGAPRTFDVWLDIKPFR